MQFYIFYISVLRKKKTWSFKLRQERRLRVFENRVLRRIFGPERDEVTGDWTTLHNEKLYAFYSLPNIIRLIKSKKTEMGEACSTYGESICAHRVLLEKSERRRRLEKPRLSWEDNI